MTISGSNEQRLLPRRPAPVARRVHEAAHTLSRQREQTQHGPDGLAGGLGWFSIGLGMAEVAAPGQVARLIGVPDHARSRNVLRAAGLRELSSGVGILSGTRPAGWLWARVAGDVMDLALLGTALNSRSARRERVALATVAVVGVTLLDVLSSQRAVRAGRARRGLATASPQRERGVSLKQAITVNRPIDQVYRFWRDLQNLPRFMGHLVAVEASGERTTHWRARGPLGSVVEWQAEIIEDRPNQSIAWRTVSGDIDHAGSVNFMPAPGGRGTEVHVELHYQPPAGVAGAVIARLFGEVPEQQIRRDMRAFKQVLETGEVLHSDASIHRLPHPAQPAVRPGRTAAAGSHSGEGDKS